jgi:hypothetical protein
MYSGQTLLTIGGILLLTFAILTFYESEGSTTSMTIYNEAVITATGLGQSIIEEIALRPFDENTIGKIVDSPDSLTDYYNLGPDTELEKLIANMDDIDDFDGYTRKDSLSRLGNFNIKVDVNYVKYEEPDSVVFSRTFYKQAVVSVTNTYLVDTLRLSYTASY